MYALAAVLCMGAVWRKGTGILPAAAAQGTFSRVSLSFWSNAFCWNPDASNSTELFSLWACHVLWGFSMRKKLGRRLVPGACFFFFSFLSFLFSQKMIFGQDPFQNLADNQSNSQCLSKGPRSWTPSSPCRRPGTKPWQRAQLWGFDSVQTNRWSQAKGSNSKTFLLLLLSHLPPCQHGCSQALCHISAAQGAAPGAAPRALLPRPSAEKDGLSVAEIGR